MKDTELYSQILGIKSPWKVVGVKVSLSDDEVEVSVTHGGKSLVCPQCSKKCPGYDKRCPVRPSAVPRVSDFKPILKATTSKLALLFKNLAIS